jgi:hypothetical protein
MDAVGWARSELCELHALFVQAMRTARSVATLSRARSVSERACDRTTLFLALLDAQASSSASSTRGSHAIGCLINKF